MPSAVCNSNIHVLPQKVKSIIKRSVCVYSNSRNDVPRVAQRYGTIAAHTRRRASVLVVFVVFCVHMHSFAGLIRRTPPPTFSDTAITDRHSDTTIFQLRAHWVRISWSIGSEESFGHVPPVGVDSLHARRAPYPLSTNKEDKCNSTYKSWLRVTSHSRDPIHGSIFG